MFSKFPVISRFVCFIALPIILLLLIGIAKLHQSVPDYRAAVSIDELANQVVITRDKHGIPLITGATDQDVFFAMGYVQAQDRLWQMETQRRLAQGRLSEVFGQTMVNRDIWMRSVGLYHAAQQAWLHLSPAAQAALQSYADGVNSWLAKGNQLPPEFGQFKIKPGQWTPVDSIALGKLFALTLGMNHNNELERQLAHQLLPRKHFLSLHPGLKTSQYMPEISLASLSGLLEVSNQFNEQQVFGGKNIGSNAWAVSGALTKSGHPILAMDSHLALQIPSFWYAARLQGKTLHSSGMTLVGFPIIVFGENRQISWGGTNLMADVQDLVSERLHPDNSNLYWHQGRWLRFSEREEVIHIAPDFPEMLKRAIKPITIKVRSTVAGPVISDVVGGGRQVLSFRWTGLAPTDTSFESFYKLNYATDWDSFRHALSFHVAPTLNMLYADKKDNIGHSAAGRIPVRRQGQGVVPAHGEEPRWGDYISWGAMGQQYNPKSGFIVSAEHQMSEDDSALSVENDWANQARAHRITELLTKATAGGKKIDAPYVMQMQHDVVDLNAVQLISTVKTVLRGHEKNPLLQGLYSWNGDMRADSYAPALYVAFVRQLKKALYMDEFNNYHASINSNKIVLDIVNGIDVNIVDRTLKKEQFWCDSIATKLVESCTATILSSLDIAQQELTKLSGKSNKDWRWMKINNRRYAHTPFIHVKVVRDWLERKTGGDGTPDTINIGGYYFDESQGYMQIQGASFRQVFEMNPIINHYLVNSTGQSGNFLSEFYDDMTEAMQNNVAHEVGSAAEVSRTVLSPARTSDVKIGSSK